MDKKQFIPKRQIVITMPKDVKLAFDSKVKKHGLKKYFVVNRLIEKFNAGEIEL